MNFLENILVMPLTYSDALFCLCFHASQEVIGDAWGQDSSGGIL